MEVKKQKQKMAEVLTGWKWLRSPAYIYKVFYLQSNTAVNDYFPKDIQFTMIKKTEKSNKSSQFRSWNQQTFGIFYMVNYLKLLIDRKNPQIQHPCNNSDFHEGYNV